MDNKEIVRTRLIKMRFEMLKKYPFYASLLNYITFDLKSDVEICNKTEDNKNKKVKRANEGELMQVGMDGVIVVNQDRLSALSEEHAKHALMHGVLHAALYHGETERIGIRNRALWNTAADIIVENILSKEGLECSFEFDDIRGMGESVEVTLRDSVESVYTRLVRDGMKPNPNSNDIKENTGKDNDSNGEYKVKIENFQANVRECIRQNSNSLFNSKVIIGKETVDKRGGVKSDKDNVSRGWEKSITTALNYNTLPVQTWSKPSRRSESIGAYLPGNKQEGYNIVAAVDTSGSISQENLDRYITALKKALSKYKAKLTIIQCDADIKDVQRFNSAKELEKIIIKGGGGTDFAPVFEYIAGKRLYGKERFNRKGNVDLLVYFTDLDGNYPDECPMQIRKVLWVVDYNECSKRVPFGKVVCLRNK